MRYIAGLPDDVTLDPTYNNLAQHGAVLAVVGEFAHWQPKPPDMAQDFYDIAIQGTTNCNLWGGHMVVGDYWGGTLWKSSNLAWGGGLPDAVLLFMSDPFSPFSVGHRSSLLYPPMQKTGMGATERMAIYSGDSSRSAPVTYDTINWPSAGPFPVEMFTSWPGARTEVPWSITLNPALYSWTEGTAGHTVTLRRQGDGRTWTFTSADTDFMGQFFKFSSDYGVGNCFIFRPDPATVTQYTAGDVFEVTLSGGIFNKGDNSPATISYTTEFISLHAFRDVADAHPYAAAIQALAAAGVVSGYDDGRFGPNDLVKRAQFAKMIDLSLGFTVTEGGATMPFVDVERPTNNLYPDDFVAVAYQNHLVEGKDATHFQPYVEITRAQVMTMIVRAAKGFKASAATQPPAGWQGTLNASDPTHGENIAAAEYNGLLAGIDLSGWNIWGKATRGEVAQIMWNLRQK